MNKSNQYYLAIEALAELKPEILAHQDAIAVSESLLAGVLENLSPLPREALFLGQAEDGLPVLLNLLDPAPGPLLIQGDTGSGKTEFLRSVGAAIEMCHSEREVQYGVVTARPEEWNDLPPSPERIGIFSVDEGNCSDFIQSLNTWAHANRSEQSVILLWDGLDAVNRLDPEIADNFRWMLLRGPAKKVWPIVTLNTSSAHGLDSWSGFFRTAINGAMLQPNHALIKNSSRQLYPRQGVGTHPFSMQDGNSEIRIWMPQVGNSASTNLFKLSAG